MYQVQYMKDNQWHVVTFKRPEGVEASFLSSYEEARREAINGAMHPDWKNKVRIVRVELMEQF